MKAWKNSAETQQSGHAPRSGTEIKDVRSSVKDGVPERLRCRAIQNEVSWILQWITAEEIFLNSLQSSDYLTVVPLILLNCISLRNRMK